MSSDADTSAHFGTYGLRIRGSRAEHHLPVAPVEWPELIISRRRGLAADADVPPPGSRRINDSTAVIWLAAGTRVTMDRVPLRATFESYEAISDDALLHPFLALPAAIAGFWLGRQVLHGGAFIADDRAWAILGDSGAGKSSLLAELIRVGAGILADDVLIIENGFLYPGPSFVDLRSDVAATLGGQSVGVLGNRPRWRLHQQSVSALLVPLGGFVQLQWGSNAHVTETGLVQRLEMLTHASELALTPSTAGSFADLLALPMLTLTRPLNLSALADSAGALLDAIAAQP
jgi:hypothetical protein